MVYARIASGETKGDLTSVLRHLGAIAQVRKTGRQADMELSAVRKDALALVYDAFANTCDVE
jgi:hypothetical protein